VIAGSVLFFERERENEKEMGGEISTAIFMPAVTVEGMFL
jgi:hypothetical protein